MKTFNLAFRNNTTFRWTRDVSAFADFFAAGGVLHMAVRKPDGSLYEFVDGAASGGAIEVTHAGDVYTAVFTAPLKDMRGLSGVLSWDCRGKLPNGATEPVMGGLLTIARGVDTEAADATSDATAGIVDTVSVVGETDPAPVPLPLALTAAVALAQAARDDAQTILEQVEAAIASTYSQAQIDAKDADTLLSAKGYTDGLVGNAAVTGEMGIIHGQYPVGDVRRYGIFGDGLDLTGLGFASGSPNVTAPGGTFVPAMIGMAVCSPNVTGSTNLSVPTIVAVAPDGSSATLSSAAVATQVGAMARIGTYWERDHAAYMTAVYQNAVNPLIEIYVPPGKYVTTMNGLGALSSNGKWHFASGVEFSGLLHWIADAGFPASGAALTNVRLRGQIVAYDRFGAIGMQNSDLAHLNVLMKSDPTKSLTGTVGRGVHMYTQIANVQFGSFVVENAGVGEALNCDGAFIVDSSDCRDYKIARIHVIDSGGHGVILMGQNVTLGELRVDAYGSGAADRQISETVSLAQSQELKGVWLHRAAGMKIETLRIGHGQPSGRANALYQFMATESGNGVNAGPYGRPEIVNAFFANVTARGVSIGDRNNTSTLLSEVAFHSIDIWGMAGQAIAAGYSFVHVNPNSGMGALNKLAGSPEIRVHDWGVNYNSAINIPANTEAYLGVIDTTEPGAAYPGVVLNIAGKARVLGARHRHSGGSGAPTAYIITPTGPTYIGTLDITDGGNKPSIIAVNMSGAVDLEIGPINVSGYRSAGGVVNAINMTRCLVKLGKVIETTSAGYMVRFQGNNNVRLEGGYISGGAIGIYASANTNIHCSAASVNVSGNTTNTTLGILQFLTMDGCINLASVSTTVAQLPAASGFPAGTWAYATDLTSPAYGAAAVGGGSTPGPVYSDTSIWRCA